MGKFAGEYTGDDKSNYEWGPAAIVNGKPTKERKLTNHMMVGPDHSLIHPGLFPLNPQAIALADVETWTKFDWKSGWGTDDFEDEIGDDYEFPEEWENYDDRLDASEIIQDNVDLLNEYMDQRLSLLRNGYGISDIVVTKSSSSSLAFKIKVDNLTDGHSVPTGFALRPLYLRVEVKDSKGEIVYQSGNLDPNGDFLDEQSLYVQHGILNLDTDLFNLQPKFTVRNIRGGERPETVPVNYSGTPLPFLRPFPMSFTFAGRPKGIRLKRHGIKPGDYRWAKYKVKKEKLKNDSEYTINIKLIGSMLPVNLIHAVQGVGFEYGMTTKQLADRVVSGNTTIWEYEGSVNIASGNREVNFSQIEAKPYRFEDLK